MVLMTLREILELLNTKGWNAGKVAKEKMPFGVKKFTPLLDELGFKFSNSGQKGWTYHGDEIFLDDDIMNFVGNIKTTRPKADAIKNPEIKKVNKLDNQESISNTISPISTKTPTIKKSNPSNKEINKTIKKVTYEIEEENHIEIKIRALREKRNVSELVNQAIKNYLEE